MAVNVNIRSLVRAPMDINGTTVLSTADATVDVSLGAVRRDLHKFLGQWVVSSAGGAVAVVTADTGTLAANAAQTGATVATANANAQTGSYVQADVQTIATLANALKTDYNKTITDVGTIVTELNNVRTLANTIRTALLANGLVA